MQKKDGFWWSPELDSWMISNPAAIATILRDSTFSVYSYEFDEVASRLGISLPHHKALRTCLPLALEGEKHTASRQRLSEEISANTARALELFESELKAVLRRHFIPQAPSRFCAVKRIIQPSIRSANLAIAGLDGCDVDDLESLPQFFDRNISLKKRRKIERLICDLHRYLPKTMSDDEKYHRIAMLALNMNTLLGSVSESFLTVIKRNPGTALSAMDWDRDPPATALPKIERKALADTTLYEHDIKAGQRVRLFVDVDGYDWQRGSQYTELYFATGPHRCPGMSYSRKVWKIFVKHLRQIDSRVDICQFSYRPNDEIFTILDKLEIELA